ncbi:hypothetical protein [Burkholderia sp. BCC1644]|uniref:hypothetical protein n=1 Tax=Burkholderia sp. BCC1644 TaxID=2676293 RepID=UPI001590B046|nr:hypothetical protein [Burkholderia sp. BCC1644]
MATRRIERRVVTDMASKAEVLPVEPEHRHKVSQRDRMASLASNVIPDAMTELSAQAQALRMGYD